MEKTEIKEIGEFGLIDRIGKNFTKPVNKETYKGIGDDAAVLDYACNNNHLVLTQDLLTEAIHFDLTFTPLQHLGYKAVAVNISDIAAMNAIPKQITIGLALSSKITLEAVDVFYEGVQAACYDYAIDLCGGDITSSAAGLFISVSAMGANTADKITYRSGAKPDDIICVTGDLGAAFLGLQVLEQEKKEFETNPDMQPQLESKNYIVGRQLKPRARMDIVHELHELDIVPTSMIDVSDGLASEILHICKNSDTGAAIYEEKLPIASQAYETAETFELNPTTCILNGGEDYELLFTIDQKDFEKVKNHDDITAIGHILENQQQKQLITSEENAIDLKAQGWTHF